MEELKKKLEELGRAFEEFKSANDQRLKEIQTKGSASSLTIEKVEKASAEIEKLVTERDALQKQVDEIKTVMARMNQGGGNGGSDVDAKEVIARKNAMDKFLRKGAHALSAEEKNYLSTQSSTDGGYFVLPERSAEIVKKVFESSPIRQLASVQAISSDVLEIMQDLDEADAEWVGEVQSRSQTNTPTFKMVKIPVHEMSAKPRATQRFLDDASIDVQSWLSGKVADKFARKEATAFVNGTGVNQPRGILTYPAGTSFGQIEQVNSGTAATIADADGGGNGLIATQDALKEAYQANASWLMKRATRSSVRKMKDTQKGYIWQPGLQAGVPDTILGKPVHLADDMPAEGAGNLVAAYGDIKQAYQVVDRIGVRVLVDPFTADPFVIFKTTTRVGGDMKNFEALKLTKCSS